MKLSINTPSYNEKRYGKPYIGKINPADGKVTAWGTWIGTAGTPGFLEIEATPGEVIIEGQKDNRVNNATPNYGVVQADGTIEYMGKADAIKAARATAAAAPAPAAPAAPDASENAAALAEQKRRADCYPDLLAALKECAAICAGETVNKNGLERALVMARDAMTKAAAA
jgi:hypothetical protein